MNGTMVVLVKINEKLYKIMIFNKMKKICKISHGGE